MTDLVFTVTDVAPEQFAAAPNLSARLRIDETSGATVHAIALRCQVKIEPHKRRYSDAEAAGLLDLFGPRERWTTTLRSMLWMHADTMVQGFTGSREVDLPMPCTYDFEVSASKFLHALDESATPIPLEFLFSGTVFTKGASGFTVERVPWDRQASYDLPVGVWRTLMRMHFPNSGWVRLDHGTLSALAQYKSDRGLLTMDDAVEHLLTDVREVSK
ncbi:hypothetical protein HH308_16470 [Gordonia sp. TBRC 11910]|uniref:Uncharacterized protein n=1 Tax=Gordonia asplenii TaxID=2725283 RepID=A0A848L5B2_9ACTN|nr:DUF6084 family protein [Gordonia asplenii]NMO02808.1 hypothetical protein [Gordonia asplenii]